MGQSCTNLSGNSCNLSGVRVHEVQAGDSPASIAITHAGCPKCSIDLIRANPHKPTVTYPNGYVTFKELRRGEKLNLPDKWWSKEFDELPSSYFAALPYADGVTPGKKIGVGAPPYSDDLVAAAKAANSALESDNDAGLDYCVTVSRPGSSVNSAVHAFKLLWNATQSPPVPINTGNFESETAHALQNVIQDPRGWWDPCPSRSAAPRPQPMVIAPQPQPDQGHELSTGSIIGISLLGAGAVGTVAYLATKPRRRR